MAGTKSPRDLMSTSFRVDPEIWEKARKKARAEGVRVTEMVADLVEGYVLGSYALPKRVFPAPVEPEVSAETEG